MKVSLELSQPYDKYNQGDSVAITIDDGVVTLKDTPMHCSFDIFEIKRLIRLMEATQELEK